MAKAENQTHRTKVRKKIVTVGVIVLRYCTSFIGPVSKCMISSNLLNVFELYSK